MKVEFHWERELSGLIVHSARHVQVNLLNDDGSIPADGGQLELHWEYSPRVSFWRGSSVASQSDSRAFGQAGRAAFELPLDAAPGTGLARIAWTLKDASWVVSRGSWLRVSGQALATQRWALRSIVVLLVAWALLLPNLKGTFEYFDGLLVFFAGSVGLASVKPLRESAAQLLLRRGVALSCILSCVLGLFVAVLCFRKVYNLSLEACYFGDVLVEPKSAALVWWTDEPEGCSDVAVSGRDARGPSLGPHRSADVQGIVPWLPLLSKQVHCATDVPDVFRGPWLKSGRCRPDALESVVGLPSGTQDMPRASGKATLAYAAERDAAASPGAPRSDPWSFDDYLQAQFQNLGGLEVEARGHRGITAVVYPPLHQLELAVILPMAADEPSGSFEFLLGGRRLGSVTIQNQPPESPDASSTKTDAPAPRPQIACAKLAPAVGIQSVLLGTESLRRYYRTAIEPVDGAVFAPLCFDRGKRAAEAILTFASGWSPRTAHRIELPCGMLPAKLSLQTGAGEWLGTLEARAPLSEGAGACWLHVQALEWAGSTEPVLHYRSTSSAAADGAPDLEVTLPASTPGFGSIAWSVVRAPPKKAQPEPERPALAVEGAGDDLVIGAAGDMRRTPRRAPRYSYSNGAFVRGGCPANSVENPDEMARASAENRARSRGISFSTITVCQPAAAAGTLVASRP